MKAAIAAVALMCSLSTPLDSLAQPSTKAPSKQAAPTASGPVRAYQGPEGALVVMVEINDSKEMLVHFKKVGGALEGKTLRYLLDDEGNGKKTVYSNKKRGSKTTRAVVLLCRDYHWTLYYPGDADTTWSLRYSERDSESLKLEDVLAAYKP